MKKSLFVISALFLLAAWGWDFPSAAPAAGGPSYLYKTTFVRAAPGKLLDLIALYKGHAAVDDAAGDARPLWWRHTQGDQWDLMLLTPMGSYAEYYSQDRLDRRAKAAAAASPSAQEFPKQLAACTSWKEDVFVWGPPLETLKSAFDAATFYHCEIFISLPGRQDELYKEREMENAYQVGVGRPATFLFVRDQGAVWDIFSLGCYRDMKQWADGGTLTREQRSEAARRAGFKDADAIGPYLRSLIEMHRDTMGNAIR